MKVYTKKGDQGTTTLSEKNRIAKNDMRFALLGDMDELNSHMGLIKAQTINVEQRQFLEDIQNKLIQISGHIYNMEKEAFFVQPEDVMVLETKVDDLSTNYTWGGFILPGESVLSAQIDIARCVARRCERDFVAVSQAHKVDGWALTYMNRLSDFLYMLARTASSLL